MKIEELFEAKHFTVVFKTGRFSRTSELSEPRLHALKIFSPGEHKRVDALELNQDLELTRRADDDRTKITITRTK
jgi:hypothetical protein